MRIAHEPGDGAFEIWLGPDEPIPSEWAIEPAAIILRQLEPRRIAIVKHRGFVMTLGDEASS